MYNLLKSNDELIKKLKPLTPDKRINQLLDEFYPKDILITSSFSSCSVHLLSLIANYNKNLKISFIDTGYHFPETIEYLDILSDYFGIKIERITPLSSDNNYTTDNRIWETDPDECCYLNKVKPIKSLSHSYKIWVSGLMEWQTEYRSKLQIIEDKESMIKFYPLLDISEEQAEDYLKQHKLPRHPLADKGFHSIGCQHCTVAAPDRKGRWSNFSKSECGLHK
ncbi:phosphoadenylyl-sulfate reductase [bacterium]|nr:phosphoadenylyl-sulfate reductase [bacterium]